ncbi:MAG: hypothetical protein HQK91_14190 [Nitrospirae bacterium]|nr:hypothetical protein [Nitrospirota bacterium]
MTLLRTGALAQQGDVVGGGEFVMTRAATKNWGADFLDSLNNIQLPKMPELSLPKMDSEKFGNITQHVVHVDLNGKSYPMNTNETIFKELMNV